MKNYTSSAMNEISIEVFMNGKSFSRQGSGCEEVTAAQRRGKKKGTRRRKGAKKRNPS